ncbi:hydrophobic protein [Streptomyces sp. NPDC018964]|uniref:hydrophobic protein n=1 Tax=unclassified Streptomyces TaxID=2593676 RepID=UPI0037989602
MVPLLPVPLLALILLGAGFAVRVLRYTAIAVPVLRLLGFVMRSTSACGGRGRRYRW